MFEGGEFVFSVVILVDGVLFEFEYGSYLNIGEKLLRMSNFSMYYWYYIMVVYYVYVVDFVI